MVSVVVGAVGVVVEDVEGGFELLDVGICQRKLQKSSEGWKCSDKLGLVLGHLSRVLVGVQAQRLVEVRLGQVAFGRARLHTEDEVVVADGGLRNGVLVHLGVLGKRETRAVVCVRLLGGRKKVGCLLE